MTETALDQLLAQARGPMGPGIVLDLGTGSGPLRELAGMLTRTNGFFLFNAGVQVYRAGERGLGPELIEWNSEAAWKDTYAGLADEVFCFGQDLFGVQFGIVGNEAVVAFNPETAEVSEFGESLEDWAAWLLEDPEVRGAAAFAKAYQDANGPLRVDQRLIPLELFVGGGSYDHTNLVVRDAAEAMRIRGPIAQQIHDLADGTAVSLEIEEADAFPQR